MSPDQHPLEERVALLEAEVRELRQRLDQFGETDLAKPAKAKKKLVDSTEASNEVISWASKAALLPRISSLCFLLVVALGLRTMADSEIIAMHVGALLGMTYAGTLLVTGHYLYKRVNPLAPVFTLCGGILMMSVATETYTRFGVIPMELAYILLAITGIGMAITSYVNRVALPIIVGTLGMCLAGVAIDYPTPYFPYMGLLLWIANILGYFATRLKRCSWLRWLLMFTTHFMLQLWGLKLGMVILRGEEMTQPLAPNWFLPIVALIGFSFMFISLFGIIRSGDEKISKFDYMLPSLNAAWCYVIGMYVIHNPPDFGGGATAAAILHFAIAHWLAGRKKTGAPGTNTFITGGSILLAFALPALFGSMLLPLPILSALALGIAYYSREWGSGGMRVTSYLLQAYVTFILTIELSGAGVSQNPIIALTVTALCGLIGLAHYRFCRHTRPPAESSFFSQLDKQDRSAIFVLLAGLSDGYFMTMVIVYHVLLRYMEGNFTPQFMAIQSVSINGAATVIMILAMLWRHKELRNVSILVTILGGAKVFLGDMLSISGLPLVISVFSFGAAAAIESLALGRLQFKESSERKHFERLQTETPPAPEERS